MGDPKKHAKLSASSAKRWFECPGSPSLIEKAPPQASSSYAEEGTIAHGIAELAVTNDQMTDGELLNAAQREIEVAAADYDPLEMVNGAKLYRSVIMQDIELLAPCALETEVALDELAQVDPDLGGTPDAYIVSELGVVIVYDYKYGAGLAVEVVDNVQLMIYVVGVWLKLTPEQRKVVHTVELKIIQPRKAHKEGPVRTIPYYANQIEAFMEELAKRAKATRAPKAKLKAGDHCKFCPAQVICPEIVKHAQQTAMMDFDKVPVVAKQPENLDMSSLLRVLDNADMIKDFVKNVEAFMLNRARSGEVVPGYKLVKKKANRKWREESRVPFQISNVLGPVEWPPERFMSDPEVLSPAQIEKLLPKDQRLLVDGLCTIPDTGEVLVPHDDPRPAISNSAALDFEKIEQTEKTNG